MPSTDHICYICGTDKLCLKTTGTDYEYSAIEGTFSYYFCQNCKHVGQAPIPSIEVVSLMYDENYYTVNSHSPLFLKGFIYKKKIDSDVKRILDIEGINSESSIMDIGCGDGARLLQLREILGENAKLTGLDLAFAPDAEKSFNKANVTMQTANIEADQLDIPDDSLDLVIMSQLIEHLVHPRKAVEIIIPKLKPGGMILIETPNIGGLDHRLFNKRYWGGYHIPRHLQIFSTDSLKRMVTELKLSVERQRFLPSPGFWIISFRNALNLNSIERGNSIFESINFSNILFVGIFTLIDKFRLMLGLSTSNQQMLAKK
jgi:2-polyprenyl-3-methyl-5-hydroxy-6-metoxy-1,4-benzoquinol methylase